MDYVKLVSSRRRSMKANASMVALASAASLFASGALAQAQSGTQEIDEIVVTGSAIRGVAAVGSNLVQVGQEDIQAIAAINASQLVNTVPSITNTGSAPQGENGVGYFSPQIHALGASASNTTLVIIDGMRMVGGGTQYAQTDPNIVPTPAIQRVEVLADGASSVYGSDAVAGVVNFITRSRFNGLEVNGRMAFAAGGYRTRDFNLIAGSTFDRGSVYLAIAHTKQDELANTARPQYALGDFRPVGGSNIQSYLCSPATIRTPASGNARVYLSPSATSTVAAIQDNAPCNLSIYGAALPQNQRNNIMLRSTYEVTDKLTVTGTMIYNRLAGRQNGVPAGLSGATAFGPGSGRGTQINPFFRAPAGEPTATTETISWLNLLSPRPVQKSGNETFQTYGIAEYDLGSDWSATWSTGYGRSRSYIATNDAFCQACALLALNGTARTNGSLTQSVISGQNIIVSQALTPANALDVWNPLETNRTSAAVIRSLYSNDTSNTHINKQFQTKLETQGPLFEIAAGAVRMAAGIEYMTAQQNIRMVEASAITSTGVAAAHQLFDLSRNVWSGYGELAVPLVSPDMNVPMVQELDLSLSARYDHYNDVGSTTNPKIAASWRPFDFVKLRGNWATAFVAPALYSVGDPAQGGMRGGGASNAGQRTFTVAFFPEITRLPGADCSRVVQCTVGLPGNEGISRGFGRDATPSEGKSWSLGADFSFQPLVPGLTANITYFSNKLIGGTNSPSAGQLTGTSGLRDRVTICPTGCTPEQVEEFIRVKYGATVTDILPSPVYFMIDGSQSNVLNINLEGIDYVVDWRLPTDRYGTFRARTSGTIYTKFEQSAGTGPFFSTLGTSGFNTQFPSLEVRTRTNFGWDYGGFSADVFISWTPPYRNWSANSVAPVISDAVGPIAGGDRVAADVVTDLTLNYEFQSGRLARSQVYLNVANLFDRDPPFYNGATPRGPTLAGSTNGYNAWVSNPLGRVISIGFRGRF